MEQVQAILDYLSNSNNYYEETVIEEGVTHSILIRVYNDLLELIQIYPFD